MAQRGDRAIPLLAVSRDPLAQAHLVGPQPVNRGFMQQHVEAPAMDRVLIPVIACQTSARFAVDFASVEPHQRPLLRRNADGVHHHLVNAQIRQFAHRIGLQVDPHAQRPGLAHALQHQAIDADLVEGQGEAKASDTASGDENAWLHPDFPSFTAHYPPVTASFLRDRVERAYTPPHRDATG